MTKAPILVKVDHGKRFILETDASQNHVGVILMQYSEEGLPQVIAYFSKKLRPTKVKYATTDKEALAVVLACRQFHHYLWGTDHQPIVSVFKQGTKSPRMNRWILEMRDYRYKIEYKAGKDNVVADQLSRPVLNIREMEDKWLGRPGKS